MTSKLQLNDWFDKGVKDSKEFMIIVCDTFDWEDYPVYCMESDFKTVYKSHNRVNMQKIMEVYDLSMDKNDQLNEGVSMNVPQSYKE
jgi:hypothetical protein